MIWLVLLFASAGVLEHAGIKIPYFAFFAHDSGKRCEEAPMGMLVAMGISAILCVLIGLFPMTLLSAVALSEYGLCAIHYVSCDHTITALAVCDPGLCGAHSVGASIRRRSNPPIWTPIGSIAACA